MEWIEDNGYLIKDCKLKNFKQVLEFVNKVGELAENADHHPDIYMYSYNNVKIVLTTHSENKLTQKDYDLAKQIDELNYC